MANTPIAELAVGDQVAIKRNLEHPANMKRIASSEYDVDNKYIADPTKAADVDLGTARVTERRTDFYGKQLARLDSGFWYNLADGYQDGSGATIIAPV